MSYIKYTSTIRTQRLVAGFSLLELMFVLMIISVLLYFSVPPYEAAKQKAEVTVINDISHQFSTAVAMLHSKGVVKRSQGRTNVDHRLIEVKTHKIYLNEYGWPANTTARFSADLANQTAYECQQLWIAVLQNPPPVALTDEKLHGKRYIISKSDNDPHCRYTLITRTPDSHYFEYNLKTGQVLVTKP